MRHLRLTLCVVGMLLVAAPVLARADSTPDVGEASRHLLEALTDLGVTVSIGALQELSEAGERLAKDHVEVESWHGPGIEPDEYVGGFDLKLYPKGKSQSEEHFKAETYFRFDHHGLKALEFSTSRQ